MGFLVCTVRQCPDNCIAVKPVRGLVLGGPKGIFSRCLPELAKAGPEWRLSPQELLERDGFQGDGSEIILFDLTPGNSESVDYYELCSVRGRTVSKVTDLLFHLKVACGGPRSRYAIGESGKRGELLLPSWSHKPVRYEQVRLEGGTLGGTWLWSEPLQSMSATVI